MQLTMTEEATSPPTQIDEVPRILYARKENDKHIAHHSCKDWPTPPDPERIVEAFGARKCPKLIEQVNYPKVHVRIAALKAIADVLKSPYDVVNCLKAGIVKVLVDMMIDAEVAVRQGSTRAFAIASKDPNFRMAVLNDGMESSLKAPLSDPDPQVRVNTYQALLGLSGNREGAAALVAADYLAVFMSKVEWEGVEVQALILETLRNCVGDMRGTTEALSHKAVEMCIKLLSSPSTPVKKEAAAALTLLCFAEPAKEIAIRNGAVGILANSITDIEAAVRAAAAAALTAMTTTDEGKKQIFPCGGVHRLVRLLDDEDDGVVLNALKTLANAAVFPEARRALREDGKFLTSLDHLRARSQSPVIQKHAEITRSVVLWNP